jgi:hypothetical protein
MQLASSLCRLSATNAGAAHASVNKGTELTLCIWRDKRTGWSERHRHAGSISWTRKPAPLAPCRAGKRTLQAGHARTSVVRMGLCVYVIWVWHKASNKSSLFIANILQQWGTTTMKMFGLQHLAGARPWRPRRLLMRATTSGGWVISPHATLLVQPKKHAHVSGQRRLLTGAACRSIHVGILCAHPGSIWLAECLCRRNYVPSRVQLGGL